MCTDTHMPWKSFPSHAMSRLHDITNTTHIQTLAHVDSVDIESSLCCLFQSSDVRKTLILHVVRVCDPSQLLRVTCTNDLVPALPQQIWLVIQLTVHELAWLDYSWRSWCTFMETEPLQTCRDNRCFSMSLKCQTFEMRKVKHFKYVMKFTKITSLLSMWIFPLSSSSQ